MSRAFVKDDAPEAPLVIPPRAPLPHGATNVVTARGLALLRAEKAALEAERARLDGDERDDAKRERAVLVGRLGELAVRLASARVVDPRRQPQDEVRFGATVTLRTRTGPNAGEERRITIVGVDEADAASGCVAFTAPIARAVNGKRAGESASLRTARGEETLEVVSITYETAG